MNNEDLAYIAGFFDGEGTATIRMVKNRHGKRTPRVEARVAQNDRAVLDWIQEQFGFGAVYIKTDKRNPNTHHSLNFSWKSARIFLTEIEPFLKVKKENVKSILDRNGRESLNG